VIRAIHTILVVVCMIAGAILAGAYGVDALSWLARWLAELVPMEKEDLDASLLWVQGPAVRTGLIVGGALAGAVLGAEIGRLLSVIGRRIEQMETEEKINAALAIPLGVLISLVFYPLLLRVPAVGPVLAVLFSVVAVFLVITGVNSVKEGLPWSKSRQAGRRRNMRILDTNVIIDGRVAEIIRTGFLDGQVYIPGFVLDELQTIADSVDSLKRARGRRGLDILASIQKDFAVEVRQHDRLAPESGEGVDARLVRLAKELNCDIITNDYNLSKVAKLEGVRVLNVNDLALALKPNVLPGESLNVTVIREGKERGQGVAYLDDGTMVVIEGGEPHIGETIDVAVTSVIQTVAGKMIFAAPGGEGSRDAQDVRGASGRR
jgi:uncharacterized protein YacL